MPKKKSEYELLGHQDIYGRLGLTYYPLQLFTFDSHGITYLIPSHPVSIMSGESMHRGCQSSPGTWALRWAPLAGQSTGQVQQVRTKRGFGDEDGVSAASSLDLISILNDPMKRGRE